ncbi:MULTISPECIES: right-handed parallel beta-helix repeat-containing protein [unclassified Crossiella]|uniref:right-handed parallel beta-helix repeat-containing protein n=1 Tax=unclassified Crossiella TaxID=2620835 RepID=UPI001FFE3645|nr:MULTISPECIES: right-handed parallel beta-helix repeat-containing protein [unclassified Crossiella]MCK2241480.1 right-handed parallel beta-helix repeat-containing protein [Crossiella sp. S99.2]MCK2255648.1 right-handed parallel beta-helix repeat-containing protein [Crossiella sp. S99.1]
MIGKVSAVIAAMGVVVALTPAAAGVAEPARSRLVISQGGTAEQPLIVDGTGKDVNGITVNASHVVIRNFRLLDPEAPGIRAQGNNITLEDNTITKPRNGDGDGIRFFGAGIKILRNTISGTSNRYGHADCMQTYATNTPASQDVLIEGNRCEKIDNMCLMAEGPNEGEGSGRGHSHHFTIRGNFCETLKASQTLMFEDIQHATIEQNEFAASPVKAIGLAIKSTNATVRGNKVSPGIRYEVGIDDSSRPGYQGPKPGGRP